MAELKLGPPKPADGQKLEHDQITKLPKAHFTWIDGFNRINSMGSRP